MKQIYLFLCVFILSSNVIAGTIKDVIVFGDSLSDNGNLYHIVKAIPTSPPYYQGRFSNGPIWAELVGNYYYKKNYANVENFAYGGATAVLHQPLNDPYAIPVTLEAELNEYLIKSIHGNKEHTLFILWIGGNDYLDESISDINAITKQVVDEIHDFVSTLINKGGRYFLILNLPDLGKSPLAKQINNGEWLHELTVAHNNQLYNTLNLLKEQHPNIQFIYFDTFAALNAIIAHLDLYNEQYNLHILNTTDPCWQGDWFRPSKTRSKNELKNTLSSNQFFILGRTLDQNEIAQMVTNSPSLTAAYHTSTKMNALCEDADSYLFWDILHPTAVVHQVLSQMVIETLEKKNVI